MKIAIVEPTICPECKKKHKKVIYKIWSDKCSECYEKENILAEYAEGGGIMNPIKIVKISKR